MRFKDLPQFVNDIHSKNITYVPIMDAGIAMRPWGNYSAYDEAVAQDLLIKWQTNDTLIGRVWPNEAVYPDWFNPKTTTWW